jgi:peptide deformylase
MKPNISSERPESPLLLPKLKILTYPDEVLTRQAVPLTDIDGRVQELIDKMAATMYEAPGIGLASIQVGWEESLLVYDISPRDQGRSLQVIVNPRIIESDGQTISENEGCLSVPDYRADVKRAERVLVEGCDRHGKPLRVEAEGLHAIVLQHEIDHLNGKLFIDRISSLKRELYKRRVRKSLRAHDD